MDSPEQPKASNITPKQFVDELRGIYEFMVPKTGDAEMIFSGQRGKTEGAAKIKAKLDALVSKTPFTEYGKQWLYSKVILDFGLGGSALGEAFDSRQMEAVLKNADTVLQNYGSSDQEGFRELERDFYNSDMEKFMKVQGQLEEEKKHHNSDDEEREDRHTLQNNPSLIKRVARRFMKRRDQGESDELSEQEVENKMMASSEKHLMDWRVEFVLKYNQEP